MPKADDAPTEPRPLRRLPAVHRVLGEAPLAQREAQWSRARLVEAVGQVLAETRAALRSGAGPVATPYAIAARAGALLDTWGRPGLRRVINATGVVLHTNLGRAPLGPAAIRALVATAGGYTNLEFDLDRGERGSRHVHAAGLIRRLTGAADALVVNNNAAAVLLVLAAVAAGREVIVSRGELVEIGGGFRVPDVMRQSGARLCEIGTTNRTHLADYRRAIGAETAALLRVHRSNFRLVGFTSDPPLPELAGLARDAGLPLIFDLGSGSLVDLGGDEPTVPAAVAAGCDLVTFSGDKLLGGPQAGIVCGGAEWVDLCRRHPLARALRIDKLSLAALEATLLAYLHPEPRSELPVLDMLLRPAADVQAAAQRLAAELAPWAQVVSTAGQAGGGSLPGVDLASAAVAVDAGTCSAGELARRLRQGDPPVVGRIQDGRLLLDPRTLLPGEVDDIVRCVRAALA